MDQALPTGFDNTASVWDWMPQIGAMQVGQQNAIAQDNNAALQRAYQGEQDFLAQRRPLDLNKLVADTGHVNALTGHTNAQTTGLNLSNKFTEATQPGEIANKNATNQVSTGAAQGQIYEQTAAQLEMMPPGTPDFIKAAIVSKNLGLPDHPAVQQALLQRMQELPEMLRNTANKVYAASPAAKTESIKERAAQQRVETQGASSLAVANVGATSREKVAEISHNAMLLITKGTASGNFEAQAGGWGALADLEARLANAPDTPDSERAAHTAQAQQYGQMAEAAKANALKKAAASAGTAKPGAIDTSKFIGAPNATNPGAVTPTPNPQFVPNNPSLPAQPASPAGLTPSTGAMSYLIANPHLAAEFDAKYGKGAAAAVLRGK